MNACPPSEGGLLAMAPRNGRRRAPKRDDSAMKGILKSYTASESSRLVGSSLLGVERMQYRSVETSVSADDVRKSDVAIEQPKPIRSCPVLQRDRLDPAAFSTFELDSDSSPRSSSSNTRSSGGSVTSSFRFTVVDTTKNDNVQMRISEDSVERYNSTPKEQTILFMLRSRELDAKEGHCHRPALRQSDFALSLFSTAVSTVCCCFT